MRADPDSTAEHPLLQLLRARRMARAFTDAAVAPELVDQLIDLARRAPAAGNTDGREFLVLEGAQTSEYWSVTMPPDRAARFGHLGLLKAPTLIVVLVRPDAWVERYAEPDKASSGLGESLDAWGVPYWWVDGGMAVLNLLLGAQAIDLGALFFGLFGHERAVLERFAVPEGWRAVGTIALGVPDRDDDRPGRSASRPRRGVTEVIHRGSW